MRAAASNAGDEASSEGFEEARSRERVGRRVGAGGDAVAALALGVAPPDEELTWRRGVGGRGVNETEASSWGGSCRGVMRYVAVIL